ncbi:MAG: hypothetical protein GY953_58400 [bacterium]|nr:hypothetical protein [bacterium]
MAPRRTKKAAVSGTSAKRPAYQLRAAGIGGGQLRLEIWELPTPATPRLKAPELTASLKGRGLEIVETRLLKTLKRAGIRLPDLKKGEAWERDLDEDLALSLSLLFRTLAPMRSTDRIRMVAAGVDEMSREEAGYWLGMAVHRKRPRRVLAALRMLLSSL